MEAHPLPVARDLLALGFRPGALWDGSLTVVEACAIVLAAPPGTATHHARTDGWGKAEHLLAALTDVAAVLLWSKTADAQRDHPRHRPEPIPRPGLRERERPKRRVMTVAEYERRLAGGEPR